MKTHRLRLPLLVLLLALGLLVGCGDDDSASPSAASSEEADPQEVLTAALGGDAEINSGVLELNANVSAGDQGSATITLNGPFQAGADDSALPEIDFTVAVSGEGQGQALDFEGGLVLTPEGAWVSYQDTDYQLDEATFGLLEQAYAQSAALQESQEETGSLAALGIDPATWVTDVTNEGTEDLDGDEVVHVSGTGDVAKIIEDLGSVAQQTGQLTPTGSQDLEALQETVTNAEIDVYATADDYTLRQLDLSMDLEDPASGTPVSIGFSIGIADPNSEQDITAPEDAQPLDDLLGQIPGAAEALGGATGTAPPSTGGSSGGSSASPAAADDYYDCVADAQSEEDLAACADVLQP